MSLMYSLTKEAHLGLFGFAFSRICGRSLCIQKIFALDA